jgi:hypothetical protein
MEIYTIQNNKPFMSKLLKSDLFDSFEVREVVIHTAFKSYFEGTRNLEFFENALTSSDEAQVLSPYVTWAEVKASMYQLILGKTLPTYFKIVLATSQEKAKTLSDTASALFLNITYKENVITCSTGVAYSVFSLDKSPEEIWDEKIKAFLFKHEFM